MRYFAILFFTVLILIASPNVVQAQDLIVPQQPSSEGQASQIKVELVVDTQSAWNRSIPVRVRFKSLVSGKKIEVKWHFPSGLTAPQKKKEIHNFNVDQYYILENVFTPKSIGKQRIDVDVIVHGYDSFYISTASATVELDDQLLVTPKTSAYQQKVYLRYGTLVILGAGVIVSFFFGIRYFVTKLIPMWLEHEINTPH